MIETAKTEVETNDKSDTTAEFEQRNADLKPVQRRAIESLAAGRRIADVARLAGVHRNTLSRWMNDRRFVDELQRYEEQLREAARARMFGLTDHAATCIEYAIAKGDARLALQLLKTLNVHQLDSRPVTQAPREQLDYLDEIGSADRRPTASEDADDTSDDDDSGVGIGNDDSGFGNDDSGSGKGLVDSPATEADERECGDKGAGQDIELSHGSEIAASVPTPVDDSPTDASDRFNRPRDGNLTPDPRGSECLVDSPTSGLRPTKPKSCASPAALPSSAKDANALFTCFRTHHLALFCPIALFFRVLFQSILGRDSGRKPRRADAKLQERELFEFFHARLFPTQPLRTVAAALGLGVSGRPLGQRGLNAPTRGARIGNSSGRTSTSNLRRYLRCILPAPTVCYS